LTFINEKQGRGGRASDHLKGDIFLEQKQGENNVIFIQVKGGKIILLQ
jgi:hypothetical protein